MGGQKCLGMQPRRPQQTGRGVSNPHAETSPFALASRNEASETAPGVGIAPGGRASQSLAQESGASGIFVRNGTTRPSTPIPDAPRNSLEQQEARPQRSPAIPRRRERQHWTREMNLTLMNAYYKVTDGETKRSKYRAQLVEIWNNSYPNKPFTSQHLAAQVANIKTHGLISIDELQTMKAEAEERSQNRRSLNIRRSLAIRGLAPEPPPLEEPIVMEEERQVDQRLEHNEEIMLMFQQIQQSYEGIPLEHRPKLPRLRLNVEGKNTIAAVNVALAGELNNAVSLESLCHKVYCAAEVAHNILGQKRHSSKGEGNLKPPWERRLEEKISVCRKEIGVIHTYLNTQQPSRKVKKKTRSYSRKAGIKAGDPQYQQKLIQRIESLKQKIASLGNRLKRYHKRTLRYRQNKDFINNQRLFFRNLDEEKTSKQTTLPQQGQMEEFWGSIWSEKLEHDHQARWIEAERENCQQYARMPEVTVTIEDIQATVRQLKNWTAPGIDGIHNYWWKALTNTQGALARLIHNAIREPQSIPPYFTHGMTHMLPKKGDPMQPKNYRPITCLPSAYKILTSIISHKLNCHIKHNNILAWEQNGCKQKARGCKELLVIDNIITKQAKKRQKNLSVAWVDYQKAFDSVPHSWLLEVLNIYKIDPQVMALLQHLMTSWRTTLTVGRGMDSYRTREILIQRGIFQGDSLSPLWFCIALNPLSNMLNRSSYAYTIDNQAKITHLFYMDDLKLYAKGQQQLEGELEIVRNFSESIRMKFGVDKCAAVHIRRGKLTVSEDIKLSDGSQIQDLGTHTTYKYLGIQQTYEIKQQENKLTAEKELVRRTNKILKTQLNAKNVISALNIWAIPVLTYTIGILTWSKTDLERLDRKIRTLMTKHGMLHPNSAIERMYLSRREGGRGLTNLEVVNQKERKKLREYFLNKNLLVYKRIVAWDKGYTALNLANLAVPETEDQFEQMKLRWHSKALHGRYHSSLHQEDVDLKASNTYLTAGYLFPETEGAMLAIQDQVVKTRTYARHILNQQIETTKCRMCNNNEESVQHLSSGCTAIAATRYLERHNNMGKVVHQLVCLNKGLIQDFTAHHKYVPQTLVENNNTKIYWDFTVITDKAVEHNRPDMVIWDKKEKTATIIDFSVPQDYNVAKAYGEKLGKYEILAQEIKTIWTLQKVSIIPFIISANGLVHKNTTQHLKELNLPERALVWMQKAVVLGTVGIIRRIVSPY